MRRRTKWLLAGAGLVALPPVLAVVGVLWFLFLAGPGTWTAAMQKGLDFARSPGELEIEADGLRRDGDGVIRLDRLGLLDGQGQWLSLRDLALDLDFGALLSGAVTVRELSLAEIEVVRAPASDAPENGEITAGPAFPDAFNWPRAPVPVRLDALRIGSLRLGPDLVPGGAAFSVTASARDAAARQQLDVDVQALNLGEIAARAGFVRAEVLIDHDARLSDLSVQARMPVIAPLAAATGADPDGDIELDLKGQGPFGETRAELGLTLPGALDLLLDIALAADPATGWSLSVDGLANLLPGLPVPRELVGETVPVRLMARGPDETRLELQALDVEMPVATVGARGEIDLTTQRMDMTAEVQAHPVPALTDLTAGATFRDARVRLRATGSPDDLATTLDATVDGAGLDALRIEQIVAGFDGRVTGGAVDGDLRLQLQKPDLGEPDLSAVLGDTVSLMAHVAAGETDAAVTGLSLTAATFQVAGEVATPLPDPRLNGMLQLSVPDLLALPHVAGLLRRGRAGVDVMLQDLVPAGGGQVTVSSRLSDLVGTDPLMDGMIGRSARIDATVRPGADGRLDLDSRIALAAGTRLTATAGMTADSRLKANYRLLVPTLPDGLLPPEFAMQGPLTVDGGLTGSVDAPEGTVAVRATLGEAPVAADVAFALSDAFRQLRLPSLRATVATLAVEGQAETRLDLSDLVADLSIRADDIAPLAALGGVDVGGALSGMIQARATGGRLVAQVDAGLDRVTMAEADLDVQSTRLQVELTDLLGADPALSGDLAVADIRQGDNRIERADIRFAGTVAAPTVRLRAQAVSPVEAVLETDLQLENDAGTLAIRADSLSLSGGGHAIRAMNAFRVRLEPEIAVEGLRLGLSDGGTIGIDARYAPPATTAAVDLDGIGLETLAALSGEAALSGLQGMLKGRVRFDSAAEQRASLNLSLSGVRAPDDTIDALFDMQAQAIWQGDRMALSAAVNGPFETPLTAEAEARVGVAEDGLTPVPDLSAAISGRLAWNGRIGALLALLPESDHVADGLAVLDVDLSGSMTTPVLQGSASIRDARYENLMTGTVLDKLHLVATFADNGEGKVEFGAVDPAGGSVKGQGQVRLLGDERGGRGQVTLAGLHAVSREDATARLSGSTDIVWDGKAVSVTSRTRIDEAEIRLVADGLPPSVVDIELQRDRETAEQEAADQAASRPADDLPVNLDIVVDAPARLFVRGRGLDSEWGGKVTVTGSLPDPEVLVDFNVIRGQLTLLGKGFQVETGNLGITGNMQPAFDLTLARQTADLLGRIRISGNPSNPDIAFSAVPELPEDEVLPRILFDKPAQSISPLEAVQLAQSISTLTNGGRGTTDRIREAVGLDVLRVEEGTDPDSSGAVSVGRYVRDGVYVGAKQSLDSGGGSSVVVEVDVLDNVKVDAEVGSTGGSSTGITWEKRY